MAEDIITPDNVPRVDTNDISEVGLTQVASDPGIHKDLDPHTFSNLLPNPMYETSCSPSENDADRSVPVEDSPTVPETRYFQNTYENQTKHRNYEEDGHPSIHMRCNEHDDGNHIPDITEDADDTAQAIEITDDKLIPITEQNIRQNDMEASKSDTHPISPQKIQSPNPVYSQKNDQNTFRDPVCRSKALDQPNSGYTTNMRSCNEPYAAKNATTTTNNHDYGINVIRQSDIKDEIQEPIDVTEDNDYMPSAVAYVSTPLYRSEYTSTEKDADEVVPGNDNTGLPQNRHIPSSDPSYSRDGLNRNPIYVPNMLQQARCPPKKKWRDDLRCGQGYPADDGNPAECDPDGKRRCCSDANWCGYSLYHCDCRGCVNYGKNIKKTRECRTIETDSGPQKDEGSRQGGVSVPFSGTRDVLSVFSPGDRLVLKLRKAKRCKDTTVGELSIDVAAALESADGLPQKWWYIMDRPSKGGRRNEEVFLQVSVTLDGTEVNSQPTQNQVRSKRRTANPPEGTVEASAQGNPESPSELQNHQGKVVKVSQEKNEADTPNDSNAKDSKPPSVAGQDSSDTANKFAVNEDRDVDTQSSSRNTDVTPLQVSGAADGPDPERKSELPNGQCKRRQIFPL
uniref:Chitin-binding type-1 domain-containing protein n=1 Tax=Branchiostoma floridae TaxID=7739 RepID=C3ZH84_BRAFL|eukprot:XP_002592056.1 hypothetical protein BRAFLDRAFT_107134 [Branchiostoma floridae]